MEFWLNKLNEWLCILFQPLIYTWSPDNKFCCPYELTVL